MTSLKKKKRHRRWVESCKKYRLRLLELFDYKCPYCGEYLSPEKVTGDHITPRCFGGTKALANILPVCYTCNHVKAHKDIIDILFFRLKKMDAVLEQYEYIIKIINFVQQERKHLWGNLNTPKNSST